jgi:hypothetical protein
VCGGGNPELSGSDRRRGGTEEASAKMIDRFRHRFILRHDFKKTQITRT